MRFMMESTSESSAAEDTAANDESALSGPDYPSDISLSQSLVSPPDSIASSAPDLPKSAWRSANPSNRLLMPSSCLGEDFVNIDHADKVLEVFRICKNEQRGTDLIIKINSFEIHCHRVVLSSVSSYFFDILTSSTQKVRTEYIELSGIDPEVLFALIDYAYTAELTLPKKKVPALSEAASILQFSSVIDACRKHLGRYRKRSTARSRHISTESSRSRARTPDGKRASRDLSVHKEDTQSRMKKRSASASRLNNLSRPKQCTPSHITDKPKRWSSNTKLYDSSKQNGKQYKTENTSNQGHQRTSSNSRLNISSTPETSTNNHQRNIPNLNDATISNNRCFESSIRKRRDMTSVAAKSAKVRDRKSVSSIATQKQMVTQKAKMIDASSQTETKCKCGDTPRTFSPGSFDSGFRSDSAISVASLPGENLLNPEQNKLHHESDSDDTVFENNNKPHGDETPKICVSSNEEDGSNSISNHRLMSQSNAIIEEFSFSDPNHAKKLLRGLNRLRNEELFTEVMVRFSTSTVLCHRIMLESFSPFFGKLFEPEKYGAGILEVNIPKLKPDVFRKLVNFLYTSKINLVARDCVNVFKVSKKFGMEDVCDACRMFVFPDGRITKSRENLLTGSMESLVIR